MLQPHLPAAGLEPAHVQATHRMEELVIASENCLTALNILKASILFGTGSHNVAQVGPEFLILLL